MFVVLSKILIQSSFILMTLYTLFNIKLFRCLNVAIEDLRIF